MKENRTKKFAIITVSKSEDAQRQVDASTLKVGFGKSIDIKYCRPRICKPYLKYLTDNIANYFFKVHKKDIDYDHKNEELLNLRGEILTLIEKLRNEKEISISDIQSVSQKKKCDTQKKEIQPKLKKGKKNNVLQKNLFKDMMKLMSDNINHQNQIYQNKMNEMYRKTLGDYNNVSNSEEGFQHYSEMYENENFHNIDGSEPYQYYRDDPQFQAQRYQNQVYNTNMQYDQNGMYIPEDCYTESNQEFVQDNPNYMYYDSTNSCHPSMYQAQYCHQREDCQLISQDDYQTQEWNDSGNMSPNGYTDYSYTDYSYTDQQTTNQYYYDDQHNYNYDLGNNTIQNNSEWNENLTYGDRNLDYDQNEYSYY